MKALDGKKLYKKLRKVSGQNLPTWERLPWIARETYEELAEVVNNHICRAYYLGWNDGRGEVCCDD